VFSFILHLEKVGIEQQVIDLTEKRQKIEIKSTDTLNVLVAEDNPVNAQLFSRMFKKLGHNVTLANDGSVAINTLSERSFDVIFMDIEMPHLNGLEATKIIREGTLGEGVRDIPIVALTAHVLEEVESKCKQVGMNAFLTKPTRINDLISVIDELVSKV
jgi:CheY-like chemotaxis protein